MAEDKLWLWLAIHGQSLASVPSGSGYPASTKLTSLPGTTITFLISLPSM